jgi:hypothetical protein
MENVLFLLWKVSNAVCPRQGRYVEVWTLVFSKKNKKGKEISTWVWMEEGSFVRLFFTRKIEALRLLVQRINLEGLG